MAKSQDVQIKAANKHQKNMANWYKVGNKVWLLTKNIKTEHLSKKLNRKAIDFYQIKKLMRTSYWLKLPTLIKIHNIFYFNLLKPTINNLLPGQYNDLPLPVIINHKKEWKIDNILDTKKHGLK